MENLRRDFHSSYIFHSLSLSSFFILFLNSLKKKVKKKKKKQKRRLELFEPSAVKHQLPSSSISRKRPAPPRTAPAGLFDL